MNKDEKNLDYYKNNAEEDYIKTPISVLRYITELEEAMNVVRSCELVNHDFQIGDDVWITTKKLVVVADFCADGERVQVEDGCEYYLVDKDELTKVI